jgi:predicted transposase/invertase (TIGR01784 family)
VYFDLEQGEDYIYHGRTEFTGIHKQDILKLSQCQQKQFTHMNADDLFPEYYVLRINEFNKETVTPLDEGISFLKTGEISQKTKAKGLNKARERLQKDLFNKSERAAYNAHMAAMQYQQSVISTSLIEGRAEGKILSLGKVVIASTKAGLSIETITNITGLSADEVSEILNRQA